MGGKSKGKGKSKWVLSGTSKYAGPILETPPLYPPEYMEDVSYAEHPLSREDQQLINVNRRLNHFFKTSVYHLGRKSEMSHRPAKRRRQTAVSEDHEKQTQIILDATGVPAHFFPPELLGLKNSSLDKDFIGTNGFDLNKIKNMEKMDDAADKEKCVKEKEEKEPKKKIDSDAEEEAAPPEEEDYGDEDYVAEYNDVEDGAGDYEDMGDDGGGGGEF